MLVPEGMTTERQRARYAVCVYRAECTDHADAYVQVSFGGKKVRACPSEQTPS